MWSQKSVSKPAWSLRNHKNIRGAKVCGKTWKYGPALVFPDHIRKTENWVGDPDVDPDEDPKILEERTWLNSSIIRCFLSDGD